MKFDVALEAVSAALTENACPIEALYAARDRAREQRHRGVRVKAKARMTAMKRETARYLYVNSTMSQADIAAKLGVNQVRVCEACKGLERVRVMRQYA